MKPLSTPIAVIAWFLVSSLSACAVTPEVLVLESPGIRAQGYSSGQKDQIEQLQLDPSKLPADQADDLWIEFRSGNRLLFSEVTEESIKRLAVLPTAHFPAPVSDNVYGTGGYGFEFEGGSFTHFGASIYAHATNDSAFVRIGSQRSGRSLSLPCSVEEFEQVFGKATHITRRYYL